MATATFGSTVTESAMQKLLAARAANVPPPEVRKIAPTGTLCVHADDTGELAFPAFPCRGHRVKCRKTGIVTYAANCRGGNCNLYTEGE